MEEKRKLDVNPVTPSSNAVFVDTSLGTHLAMIVCPDDTVSDVKTKIMLEHPLCFPDIGDIKIHALKVKRRGHFYHLSESMLVKNAFHGVKGSWFISVDTSSIKERVHNNHFIDCDCNNLLASVGVTSNGLGDRGKLLDGHPEGLSNDMIVVMPRDACNEHVKEKGPGANQLGLNGVEEEREICINMSTTPECGDDHNTVKNGRQNSKENKVQSWQIGGVEDNARDGVEKKQVSVLPEGAVEAGSHAKRKRKSKKRSRSDQEHDASMLDCHKNESHLDVTEVESLLDNAALEVLHVVDAGNSNVADGPSMSASSNASKRSSSKVCMTDVLCEGADARGEVVAYKKEKIKKSMSSAHCSGLVEDTSQSISASRKKRKIEKENAVKDSVTEEMSLISGMEDVQLQSGSLCTDEKKSRKKASNHLEQENAAFPSLQTGFGFENTSVTSGIDQIKEPDSALGLMYTISEPSTLSRKEDCNPVPEGAGHVYDLHGKLTAACSAKIMGIANDQSTDNVGCNTHLVIQESGDREKQSGIYEHDNTILTDHQHPRTDRIGGVEDGMWSLCNKEVDETSEMLKVSVTDDSGKSSKKGKKSKGTRNSLMEAQIRFGAQYAKVPGNDISSKEPLNAVNDDQSVDASNKEINHHLINQESVDRENGSGIFRQENAVLNGHQHPRTDKIDKVEDGTSEASVTVETGKSSKKRKKSKGTRDFVCEVRIASGTQHAKVSEQKISSHESLKAVNGNRSGDTSNNEVNHHLVNQESVAWEKGSGILDHENSILDGHQHPEMDKIDQIEEETSGKSYKKRKKSKGSRDFVSEVSMTSGPQHDKVPEMDIFSSEPLKAVDGGRPVDVSNKEFNHHIVNEESGNREKGSWIFYHQITIPGGKKHPGTHRINAVEDGTSEMLKVGVTVDSGKSSKKRKKSKGTGDFVSEEPMTSGPQHDEVPQKDISPNEPLKAIDCDRPVGVSNKDVNHNLVNEESGIQEKGSGIFDQQNTILNGHQHAGTHTTNRVEDGTSVMCNAGVTVDCGKSSKKRKKTKGTRDGVNEEPMTSGAQQAKVHEKDIPPNVPLKAINGDQSVDPSNEDVNHHLINPEAGDKERGSGIFKHDSTVVSDHQHRGTCRIDRVEDGIGLSGDKVDGTSEMLKVSVTMDSGKSSKKRKKSKGMRDSVGGAPMTTGGQQIKIPGNEISSNESLKAVNDNQSIDGTNKEVNVPHKGRKDATERDAVYRGIIQIAADSLHQMESTHPSMRKIDRKSKEKPKKSLSSGTDKLSRVLMGNRDGDHKGPESSTSTIRDMKSKSELTKQTDLDNASTVDRLNRSNLECQKFVGVNDNLLGTQLNSVAVECSQNQGNDEIRHLEPVVNHNPSKPCHGNEAINDMDASSQSDQIHFKDFFVRRQCQEYVASGQVIGETMDKAKETNSEMKADKDKVLQNNKVNKEQPEKEDNLVGGCRKLFASNAGEVVDGPEHGNRWIGTSGAIPKDDNYGSHVNEDGLNHSDTSTRTPSDYSLSSDYSDGESNADLHSLQKGPGNLRRTKGVGRKLTKSFPSGMSLNAILRSSNRYKKAKLNALQSQEEDTESQPVEIVPNSCADL